MSKPTRTIPEFHFEAEERAFWESPENESTEYINWSKAQKAAFPNLKPTTEAISLRLPTSLLESIKIEANKRDVPYQSLIKVWLDEKLKEVWFGHG